MTHRVPFGAVELAAELVHAAERAVRGMGVLGGRRRGGRVAVGLGSGRGGLGSGHSRGGLAVQPGGENAGDVGARLGKDTVGQVGAAGFADDGVVVDVHVEEDIELVFHAIPLDRGHANLFDDRLVALFLLGVFLLAAHRSNDVDIGPYDGFDQVVVDGCGILPCRIGVARLHAGSRLVHNLQQAAGSVPGMGQGIEDDDAIAGFGGFGDGLAEAVRVEGRAHLHHVKGEEVGVLRCAAVFGVNHGNGAAHGGGDGQGGVGFAAAGRAGDGKPELGFVFDGFLKHVGCAPRGWRRCWRRRGSPVGRGRTG